MRARLQTALDENPAFPLGIVAVGIWVIWGAFGGGFEASEFGLLGALLVLLLALGVTTIGVARRPWERRRVVALAALAAFVVWTYLSLLWADFPGDAWIGGDKTLIYAAGFALFALWPWTSGALVSLLALYVAGVAIVGAATLTGIALSPVPWTFFQDGRLVEPVDYMNGTVALWTIAFWPALYLASSPRMPVLVRSASLGAAALFVGLALLGQSRGWLVAMIVSVPLFLLLARQRLRTLLALAFVAAVVIPITRPLLQVFEFTRAGRPIGDAVDRAAVLALVSCLAAAVVGTAWAVVDSRVEVGPRAHRVAAIATIAATLAALSFGGAAAASSIDDPREWIASRWDEVASGTYPAGRETSRFEGSLGTNRVQEWEVAWFEFKEHPVLGIGADNYLAAYLERRETASFEPWYPHSLELRMLSQLGVVGAGLFAVTVVLGINLALERRRKLDAVAGGAAAAALMAFAYWAIHGSIDWFWEIPALAAPAMGLLALAGAAQAPAQVSARAETLWRPGPRTLAAGTPLLVAAVAALAFPWLAASYRETAVAVWKDDPRAAYADLSRAAALNPLSADPLLLEAAIALERGESDHARRALQQAVDREPKNAYAFVQLALVEGSARRYDDARRYVERALELSPKDPVARLAARAIEREAEIDPSRFNRIYRDRLAHLGRDAP